MGHLADRPRPKRGAIAELQTTGTVKDITHYFLLFDNLISADVFCHACDSHNFQSNFNIIIHYRRVPAEKHQQGGPGTRMIGGSRSMASSWRSQTSHCHRVNMSSLVSTIRTRMRAQQHRSVGQIGNVFQVGVKPRQCWRWGRKDSGRWPMGPHCMMSRTCRVVQRGRIFFHFYLRQQVYMWLFFRLIFFF